MRPSAGLMEVFDSRLVEEARGTHQSVYFVALLKQKFGEVGTVLAGNSGNQGNFLQHITPDNTASGSHLTAL